MKIEELKQLYNLSQDYDLLEKLILEGKHIPCFVTWDWNCDPEHPIMVTDIALARYYEDKAFPEASRETIGCRGTGFVDCCPNNEYWREKHPFISACKRYDLWFILPNTADGVPMPSSANKQTN